MSPPSTSEVVPLASREPEKLVAPLGLLLPGPGARERVAGVAVGSRAALIMRRAGCEVVERIPSPDERARGQAPLPRAEWVAAPGPIPESGLVLVALGDVAFDLVLLRGLLEARRRGEPSLARTKGGLVLACLGSEAAAIRRAYEEGGVEAALGSLSLAEHVPDSGLLLPASSPSERKEATRAILRATAKPEDGPLTRLFERRISQAISRLLLPLPVSPNLVTTVSLAIGLTGAALLASRDYLPRAVGAAIFVFATIVDGCDGEIARAKLLESPWGKLYDTAVDIIVNLAVFVGLATGVYRELEGTLEVKNAILLLLVGGALAMAVVETVRRIVPAPAPRSLLGRSHAWIERFATMEWCYLVLAFAVLDQLAFFFFGAAIGANVFAGAYMLMGAASWRRS